MDLLAAFTIGAFIAAPAGFVIAGKLRPLLPALPRRRFLIVDLRTGQVVRRFWRFGRAADVYGARYQYPLWRFDIEKR